MLSNNIFLKTRIQFDGFIFCQKALGVQVQRSLKKSRILYTDGKFEQHVWEKDGNL